MMSFKTISSLAAILCSAMVFHACSAFTASNASSRRHAFLQRQQQQQQRQTPCLQMGFFDSISKAFSNEEYAAPPEGIKATARHILVKTPELADEVLTKIGEGKSTFNALASEYSSCPSAARGGSLGSFSPGTMVKEFDNVIFSADNKVSNL